MKELVYDPDKINKIRYNYSLFHPTQIQTKIIFDLASEISTKIQLDEIVVRNLFIQAIVNWQIRKQTFHFETEFYQPQFKTVNSYQIIEDLTNDFISLLENSLEGSDRIRSVLEKSFEYYLSKYANRE